MMILHLVMSGRFGLSSLHLLLLLVLLLEVSSSDEEFSLGLFLDLNTFSGRLSLASAAVASTNASRVATAASQRDGDVAWSAHQSTLQRQGGGVIW